jgi:hypothetical protein
LNGSAYGRARRGVRRSKPVNCRLREIDCS